MKNLSLQGKFLFTIIMIIVPVLGLVFTWVELQTIRQVKEQALDQARILARQVILTRQWVTDCGGAVMIPEESTGAEGITSFFDNRFETGKGTLLRFTPAMVTKKLSHYSTREKLYSFRLTSLHPMNPENTPDDFQKEALTLFIREGTTEFFRFKDDTLDYMVPLFLEKGCLRCHPKEKSVHNNIRGGLGVIIPLKRMQNVLKKSRGMLIAAGLSLSLATILTLFFLVRHMIIKPLMALEEKTKQISQGNFDVRVAIRTGDEIEKLGNSFNTMTQSLFESRDLLEKRVEKATKELAGANEELKALDRLKSDFLTNMSHELRSPLTVIRGGINYLGRTLKKEDSQNYIRIIDKNVSRLSRLVSDLFDFTKLEHGKIDWHFERENLTDLVKEVIEIISPLAMDKNLEIICSHPGDLFVNIDFERIEQILVNLMDNAIKFSDPGTTIRVTLQKKAGWITVSVKDHGHGIPLENLETIFDKFSTVPTGRNSKTEGTGLGLAISKAIIKAHGGSIWAESTLGVSSALYFSLPESIDPGKG